MWLSLLCRIYEISPLIPLIGMNSIDCNASSIGDHQKKGERGRGIPRMLQGKDRTPLGLGPNPACRGQRLLHAGMQVYRCHDTELRAGLDLECRKRSGGYPHASGSFRQRVPRYIRGSWSAASWYCNLFKTSFLLQN